MRPMSFIRPADAWTHMGSLIFGPKRKGSLCVCKDQQIPGKWIVPCKEYDLVLYRTYEDQQEVCKEYGKPDVIMGSSAHPLTSIAGILIARRFHVPAIVEVRDLWPEAIFLWAR